MSPEQMGQVVPFITRVRESGDWTASERARLQELADRLAAGGVEVEVIFGATDEGDPWCVVTDGDGDVLIHVARIDGKFVVHSAVDDAVNEDVDLHAALRDHLTAAEDVAATQSATILPFTARQGQTFLALVVAAAFFYETAGVAGSAEAAEAPDLSPPSDAPPAAPEADQPQHDRELAVQGSAQQQAAPQTLSAAAAAPVAEPGAAAASTPAESAPTPSPITAPAAHATAVAAETQPAAPAADRAIILGTAEDDLIQGTTADEHIQGGAGDDTLSGGGGNDLLDGGAGDDRIELGAGVTASGGEGADTFVVQAPAELGRPETLLGVILDFGDGDRLMTWLGHTVDVRHIRRPSEDGSTGRPGEGEDFTTTEVPQPTLGPGLPGDLTTSDLRPTLVGPPLTRVDFDLDGDGVMDGYVLVGQAGRILEQSDPPPITLVGHGLGATDPVG